MATSSGTGPANTVSQPASKYSSLVGSGLTFAGVDQGIDFTGGPGPVYALGPGVVERVAAGGTGWPGQGALLTYGITSGPYKGQHVYIAEDFMPAAGLSQGTPVAQGQVLGIATGSGKAPGIEVGWAQPSGLPVATLDPTNPHKETQAGIAFDIAVQQGHIPSGGLYNPQTGAPLEPTQSAAAATGQAVTGAGKSLVGGAESVTDFLGKLSDPNTWLRIIEIVGGGLLVLLALNALAKELGVPGAAPPTPPLPPPAQGVVNDTFGFEPGEAAYASSQRTSREGVSRGRTRRVTLEADRPAARSNGNGSPDYGSVPF